MVFSSIEFIGIFLPVMFFVYLLAGRELRTPVLLIGSLVFYGLGEPRHILLLVATLIVNFMLSGVLQREKYRKAALGLVLIWNFGWLFFFKYFDFFAENINRFSGKGILPALHLVLPLGISFYTFQIVSYQIDVYRGTQKRCPDFLKFSLYVCMFPQLVAGPIIRFQTIEKHIKKPVFCAENVEEGLKLFTVGLGLKVLLANQIGTLFQSIQSIGAQHLDAAAAWLGAVAFSFQIYFDFWGYSLMAMGLGLMFGYQLPENFKNPYMAKSATGFWRRWHITLSAWFREYVYIPLGGNRQGKTRTCLNLLAVWSLTGLWHGADWNFLLWGLFFFVLLSIEKAGLGDFLERTRLLGHLYCILVIPVSWIIFSQTDLSVLAAYLKAMAGGNQAAAMTGVLQLARYLKEYGILLLACILCSTPLPGNLYKRFGHGKAAVLCLLGIFWLSIYQLYIGKNNPFLYFRF